MMKKLPLFAVIAGLMVSGCSVYHPQSVDIPLINHQGDLRVDASLGMSWWLLPDAFTINGTASYGFTDHIAGQAHINWSGDSWYGQIAPGYYLPFADVFVFEGYAGLGYGRGTRDNIDKDNSDNAKNNYSFSGNYYLPFVQGNLGVTAWALMHLDVAVALKAGLYLPNFDYFDVDGDNNTIPGTLENYGTTNFLLEPQLLIRFGGKFIRTNLKVGLCWMSDLSYSDTKFIYDYMTVSLGVTFCF